MKIIGKKLAAELAVVAVVGLKVVGVDIPLESLIGMVVAVGAFVWGEGWVDAKALKIEAEEDFQLWRESKGKNKAFWVTMSTPIFGLVEGLSGHQVPEKGALIALVGGVVAYTVRQALTDRAALEKQRKTQQLAKPGKPLEKPNAGSVT